MRNKVTYKEEPTLFEDITEHSVDSIMDHRRGSSFYRTEIVQLTVEDKKRFPEIENFEQYIGTWMTDTVYWDDNNGFEDEFSELTRVEKREVVSYEWVEV